MLVYEIETCNIIKHLYIVSCVSNWSCQCTSFQLVLRQTIDCFEADNSCAVKNVDTVKRIDIYECKHT